MASAGASHVDDNTGVTVLIVDDESMVRSMMAELLERYGYRVLEAADAEEAVKLCHADDGQISLLITDVAMPGTDGIELAETISEIKPGIEVLYISGYSDRVLMGAGRVDRGAHVLTKPFEVRELMAKIFEILGTGS